MNKKREGLCCRLILFSDLYLTVVKIACSPTDVNIMQPSQVADFGALAHSAGFRIEDLASFSTSMLLCSQSIALEAYLSPVI